MPQKSELVLKFTDFTIRLTFQCSSCEFNIESLIKHHRPDCPPCDASKPHPGFVGGLFFSWCIFLEETLCWVSQNFLLILTSSGLAPSSNLLDIFSHLCGPVTYPPVPKETKKFLSSVGPFIILKHLTFSLEGIPFCGQYQPCMNLLGSDLAVGAAIRAMESNYLQCHICQLRPNLIKTRKPQQKWNHKKKSVENQEVDLLVGFR